MNVQMKWKYVSDVCLSNETPNSISTFFFVLINFILRALASSAMCFFFCRRWMKMDRIKWDQFFFFENWTTKIKNNFFVSLSLCFIRCFSFVFNSIQLNIFIRKTLKRAKNLSLDRHVLCWPFLIQFSLFFYVFAYSKLSHFNIWLSWHVIFLSFSFPTSTECYQLLSRKFFFFFDEMIFFIRHFVFHVLIKIGMENAMYHLQL